MKIFLSGTSFRASYGGPAVSVSELARQLSIHGLEVGLWAPDGTATIKYLSHMHDSGVLLLDGSLKNAIHQFGRPDIFHDSGVWLPHNHSISNIARDLNIPRIVSTRGMLEPWALNHKRFKKKFSWLIYQKRDLLSADVLHATAQSEKISLKNLGLNNNIINIPNGITLPLNDLYDEKPSVSRKKALFLSRIHPKKGLPLLIAAWSKLRPDGWDLDIVGPDEGGHKAEIENLIRKNNLSACVTIHAPLNGEAKASCFQNADIFILPTYSENFGIVVAESLAFAVPVLTTHGAPWKELITHRCGWWVEPSENGILQGLSEATSCSPKTLLEMGSRGRTLMSKNYSWPKISNDFISVYASLL